MEGDFPPPAGLVWAWGVLGQKGSWAMLVLARVEKEGKARKNKWKMTTFGPS